MNFPLLNTILLCSCLALPIFLQGQVSTQRIKGRIIDQETSEPIAGVEVELMNYVPLKIVSTDESGEYELRGIPLGMHRLLLIHEQYQTLIVPDVEVVLEQPTILNIKMKKEVFAASLDVVKTETAPKKRFTEIASAVNPEMVGQSSIYDPKDQLRYAGARLDALQQIDNLPGLRPSSSFVNDLSIRGSNPLFTGLRVEGVPVDNLHHLPYPQSSSGAFSMLNPYMLDKFDVYTSGFNADYGHAAAGIVDAKLKTANLQRNDLQFHFSPLWLEASAQLPIQRERGQSLSISYRHASMRWLDALKANFYLKGDAPDFQDAFFKLNLPRTKGGDFTVFGLWGMSSAKDMSIGRIWLREVSLDNMMAVAGLRHSLRIAPKIFINTVLGGNFHINNTFTKTENHQPLSEFHQQNLQAYLNSKLEFRLNRENSVFVGAEGDFYRLKMLQKSDTVRFIDVANAQTFYTHVFAYLNSKVTQFLSFNVGLQAQYLHFSGSVGFSPRLSMKWEKGNHTILAQFATQQQQLPWFVYLQRDKFGNLINKNLDFVQNHQLSLAYHWRWAENWQLKLRAYGQYWDKVAVAADTAKLFILNNIDFYSMQAAVPLLRNNGWGWQSGLELGLEKFFHRGYYGQISATLADARFYTANAKVYNSRYNNRYSALLLIGKEFNFGAWGRNALNVDTRFFYAGGRYYTPVDEAASSLAGREIRDVSKAWAVRSPDYWSWDLRIGLKFETTRTSHQFSVECLNILNMRAAQAFGFDTQVQTLVNPGRMFLMSYRLGIAWAKP